MNRRTFFASLLAAFTGIKTAMGRRPSPFDMHCNKCHRLIPSGERTSEHNLVRVGCSLEEGVLVSPYILKTQPRHARTPAELAVELTVICQDCWDYRCAPAVMSRRTK